MRGRPFSRLSNHKLICGWCGENQKLQEIEKMFRGKHRIAYRCDYCCKGLQITMSADGYYSAYQSDKARYLRNVQKGVNRI